MALRGMWVGGVVGAGLAGAAGVGPGRFDPRGPGWPRSRRRATGRRRAAGRSGPRRLGCSDTCGGGSCSRILAAGPGLSAQSAGRWRDHATLGRSPTHRYRDHDCRPVGCRHSGSGAATRKHPGPASRPAGRRAGGRPPDHLHPVPTGPGTHQHDRASAPHRPPTAIPGEPDVAPLIVPLFLALLRGSSGENRPGDHYFPGVVATAGLGTRIWQRRRPAPERRLAGVPGVSRPWRKDRYGLSRDRDRFMIKGAKSVTSRPRITDFAPLTLPRSGLAAVTGTTPGK